MGSISSYETKDGKRYRAHFRDPDRRNREKAGFKRKKDAEDFLASITVSAGRGDFIDPTAAKKTVGELGAIWLANQSHLQPSSFKPVEVAWRVHVEPRWGARRVGEIVHSDVQTWVTNWGRGRSATTVSRAFGVLAGILDVAVLDKRITTNPARGVKLPRKEKSKRTYLTLDQVELLASQAREHHTLVQVLAYTGLRWGEATGLAVGSVDLVRRRLQVSENAVTVSGHVYVGAPKTNEHRSVPFPQFLADGIAAECAGKTPSQLVFGDGTSHLRTPHSTKGWFTFAVRRAQRLDGTFPRVTPHDLRHTAASLAISAGANVKAVQRMLGHASAAMTLDTYADLFEDDLDAVSVRLDQLRQERL